MSTSVKKQSTDRGGGKSAKPKNPPANAWSKPLAVPKKPTPPPPGMTTKSATAPPKVQELGDLRGRFVNLLLALTGQKVTITTLSGETISGILHTVTPFPNIEKARRNKYVLKGVEGKGNYVIDMEQVVQLHVPSCRLESTANQAFTDAEIAAKKASSNPTSGDLVQADASWTVPSTSQLSGNIDGWDQFKANEKLFNVKAEFDENIYTTVLDRSQVSNKDKKKAEQLAREIETSTTKNIHMAEERNQVSNQDYDEEDRYSGVLKQPAAPKLNYAQAAARKETAASKNGKEEVKSEENGEPDATGDTKTPVALPKEEVKETEPELEKLSLSNPSTPQHEEGGLVEDPKPADTNEASKSKLKATAKEFSFNVNAMEFKPPTPNQPPHPMIQHPSQPPHMTFPHQPIAHDANTGMQMMMPPMPMQPGFMNYPMMHQFPGYGMRMHPQFPPHQPPQQQHPPIDHSQHPQPIDHSQHPQQPPNTDPQRTPEGLEREKRPPPEGHVPSQPYPQQQQYPFPGGNMQPQPGYFPSPYMQHQPPMRYPARPPMNAYYDEGGRGRRGGGRRGGGRNRRGGGRGNRGGGGGRYYYQSNPGHQPEASMEGQEFSTAEQSPPPEMAPPADATPSADDAT